MNWGKRLASPTRTRSQTGSSKSFIETEDTSHTREANVPSPSSDQQPRSTIEPRHSPSFTFGGDKGLFSPRFGSNIRTGALDLLRKLRGASATNKNSTAVSTAAAENSVAREDKPGGKEREAPPKKKRMAPQAASALEERLKASAQVAKSTNSKEPRLQLEPNGRDWVMECYEDAKEPLKIEETKMNQNIFVRDNKNATLQISKKFNNLTIENCEGVNVVVDSVISAIELIRCKKCQIQVLGHAQSITIDNCQGINIYVSLQSKGIQITSSQNAEINLHVPESEKNKDDWIEVPVPCQFVHTIKEGANALDTKVSDLYH